MARSNAKKVVLFLVEGPTEETVFALIFERLLKPSHVSFDIVEGDITTEYAYGSDIRERVKKHLLAHVNRQPYGWGDLERIVHITDTDGSFVPADKVVQSGDTPLHYGFDVIQAADVEGIRARNTRKSAALLKLSTIHELRHERRSVPYAVYFLSRNMEHALHGIADDVSFAGKDDLAAQFRSRYADDLEGFAAFLRSPGIAIAGTHRETWEYIAEGTHSLERGSNLHLALPAENH